MPGSSSAASEDVIDKSANKFWEDALAKATEFRPSQKAANEETTQQVVGLPLYQVGIKLSDNSL